MMYTGAEMQTPVSSTETYGKCRCCLSEANHSLQYDAEMFRKCLNLVLVRDPRVTTTVCGQCASFLHEVQTFRQMVISSQKQLLASIFNGGTAEVSKIYIQNDLDTEHNEVKLEQDTTDSAFESPGTPDDAEDPTELYIQNDSDDEHNKVKVEKDVQIDPALQSFGTQDDVADNKEEHTVLKTQIQRNSVLFTDGTAFESKDFSNNIKTEIKETAVDLRRKRKRRNVKTDSSRKKKKKYDSDSDTPISQIKEVCRLKKEIVKENNLTKCSTTQSRKHSFIDNRKIRSNIIMILKNSTVLPFVNNFKSTYKCFYCDKLYIPFKELKEHIEAEHGNMSEDAIGRIVRSLQNVMVTADIRCIKCKICDEEFKSIENLVEHLCNNHEKVYHETGKNLSHGILGVDLSSDSLRCHLCNKDFAYFKNLSVHMNEHYGSFICCICGKKFLSEHRFKCHEFKAHATKETKCKHCGEVFKTEWSMAYHTRKEHLKGLLKCLKCPETFPSGQYMKRVNHMAEAHGIKKPTFKCDTCGKEYANSGSLAAHKRYTHKRVGELKCEICGYITVHNSVMKRHIDFHNGVKNYECEFCKRKFGKPYTLKLHLKIHLNDKRFACSLCNAAFIQKNSLKSHLKSRHPDSGIDLCKL